MYAIETLEPRPDEASERADWKQLARCRDGAASLTALFFSEQLDDIAAAKSFCGGCPVQEACLTAALERREPWGVWGGQLFVNGKVVAQKRKRGRPPKVRPEEQLPAAQIA